MRPNLTLSYGLRYEWQTNISDHGDFAPRLGFAWAPGSAKNGRQKTVIRGGFGMFYDRVDESLIKQAFLLNGINQLSYTVTNPDTFPNAPSLANLSPAQNSIYRLDPNLRSDYLMQIRDRRGAAVAAQHHCRPHLHQHSRPAHAADRAHQYAASGHLHPGPAGQRRAPLWTGRGQSLRVRIRRHACGRTS